MQFDDIVCYPPYSLGEEEKDKLLTARLLELTKKHKSACTEYGRILDALGFREEDVRHVSDIPFIPVRLFKELDLKSIPEDQIVKTMMSSGTTGQRVSKICLDRQTSANQQKTMVKIVEDYTGSSRMPMIIIDCPSVLKNRNMFSARGAGILGFSVFGSRKIYALKDDMSLDIEGVKTFLEQHAGERIFLFGFTFMIWKYFYTELRKLKEQGVTIDLSNSVLIHGGGWKKLANESVSSDVFKSSIKEVCGIPRVHDYYGMVEQTGCIYMQCECGHLHASIFSDVLVRDPEDFSVCEVGKKGIIQVVSVIPESYPGHSLLTEDEGEILGIDDCPCGRKGKYFKIDGRIKEAEIRGCSDTFAATVSKTDVESLPEIDYLLGSEESVNAMKSIPALSPFSDPIVEFCNDFANLLIKDKKARLYPDVMTLGFWLRKSSVMKMKERFATEGRKTRLGRGIIFHVAPSNVPVNFAYSMFSGLLCGNANIVRVSTKDFAQVEIINDLLQKTLDKHPLLRPYIALVRYERNNEINSFFSSCCDVRVIWGGDATIRNLRESMLNPRATEITFADRFSIAVLDSNEFVKRVSDGQDTMFLKTFMTGFYNDTYLSDQNACTSPRVIIWVNEMKEEAKTLFWSALEELVRDKYPISPIRSVDKYSNLCLAASNIPDNGISWIKKENNRLVRVKVERLSPKLMEYRGNSGYFYEYDCDEVDDMFTLLNDIRCQTVALLGDRSILKPLLLKGIKGVDRIADVGHTMDFELIWDGYDLVDRFTRIINM